MEKKINLYEMFVCIYIYIFLQINEKRSSISIQMSTVTKKKYVVNEALQRYELPDEKHYIVKVDSIQKLDLKFSFF